MNLTGKVALITGGRRLGGLIAQELAARGCHVGLSYFSQREPVEETASACRQFGVQADVFQADLRDPAASDRLINWTVERFGGLQILINLTSIYYPTPLETLQPDDVTDMIASNLTGPLFTAVAAAKRIQQEPLDDGIQGKIIHFTDWAIDRPYLNFLPYLAAKGGLATLTKALAVELAPTITVNAVAPGTVLPPPDLSEEKKEAICRASALQKLGQGRDVVEAVLYLLVGTDFITGETLRVDGGRFLGGQESGVGDF